MSPDLLGRADWRWRPRPALAAATNSDAAELATFVARHTSLALAVEDGV